LAASATNFAHLTIVFATKDIARQEKIKKNPRHALTKKMSPTGNSLYKKMINFAFTLDNSMIVLTKKYILFVLLFCAGLVAQAQQTSTTIPTNWCGTNGYSPWLTWYQDHKASFADVRDVDTSWYYIPVTIHIVGNDQGTNYYPESEALRIICELNEQYTQVRFRFYLFPGQPFVYHNNTSWFIHDWDGGAEMINSTKIDGRLNAYIVQDPAGNCGYSWIDAIVMGSGCSAAGNSTWAHEAGHHFSLPHPFFGWEGHNWDFSTPAPPAWDNYPIEKVDGSNCHTSGDRFCDTKPDYLNYRWNCTPEKESSVIQKDPNGASFRSDATIIMGYSYDACSSRFTPEQIDAMRTNVTTEHQSYLQVAEPGAQIDDNFNLQYVSPVDSSIEQYNNVVLQWEPVPNAAFYHVEISTTPYFSLIFHSSVVYQNTTLTVNKNIPNNKTMFWRVRAYNSWDLCKPAGIVEPAVFKTRNLSATNELERVADISLNPNPVVGGLPAILQVNSSESIDILITLHDASGRLFFQKQMEMYSGDNSYEIPTNNIEAGLYFVTIQTKKGTLVKRLAVID
jgi:hypothetical protein